MSKIEFEQINENEVEVIIPPDTPMEMVQQLTKSFVARGLVEDLKKSTLSVRYFYRTTDSVNNIADKLIKSLQSLTKEEELPYWHPKAQMANQKRVREMEISERRAKAGMVAPVAPISTSPATNPPVAPVAPVPATPNTLTPKNYTSPHPQMFDNTPNAQNTAGMTGKRYAYINDPVDKKDDEEDVEKSNYGPKGAKLYNPADNARRKVNNLDPVGFGPNVNAKSYSSKPGQLSGKAQSDLTARIQAAANKKQPVKIFTPEEIEAENKKRGLKKSWGQHLSFPSAEEEIMKLAGVPHQQGENVMANQLANLMVGKAMLGSKPPAQPTDQEMFGHLAVTDEMAKSMEQKWQGAAFDWLKEAAKPITKQFASEVEELAYWNSIKVADRDDGKSGY